MTIDINIVNGKIFTSEGFKEGGLSIEGEKIIRLGKEPNLEKASQKINVKGAMILPGLIDIHVHMRDLEQKYKETMETGTRSAIAGGVTTVLDMPNNKPPTNLALRVEYKKKIVTGKAAANIGFYSLIPNNTEEIVNLTKEGIFGFKIYPAGAIYPPKNNELLKTRMAKIAEMKLPLIIHPDSGFADETEKLFLEKHQDPINSFLAAHNQLDEAQALVDFLQINKKINCHLHCAHITAKETMEIMIENKDLKTLTGEVCPHHLFLTQKDLLKFKANAKCLPPLRTKEDQKILWKALNDDHLNIIATDHAPHSHNEKYCEFEAAASGIHGLETLLPVMFTGAFKGMIPLEKLIPKMTSNPAEYALIKQRGEIKEGNFADLIIVTKEKSVVSAEHFESNAKWTPFDGFESEVTLKQVFVNGHLAKDDEFVESKAKAGKILERRLQIEKEILEPSE
ncbi:MAG TPA: dihydroorotase family protein [Candidatus Bathyarchaeia archaeon]|nr:dihydroorotase family protein [Candidatus Bathyarchaeia archaeon]